MKKSIFNLDSQHADLSSKIVAGLERTAGAFRVLLWEHAKVIGLSPIQIQLLLFISFHAESLCNVSHLAHEFNLTKATISEAIRVLHKKKLIEKNPSPVDKRAYSIALTAEGEAVVGETEHFANPIRVATEQLPIEEQEQFFKSLSKLIFGLNRAGILTVQRTCYSCRFYEKGEKTSFCRLMEKPLLDTDIRLDCAEYEEKS